MSLNHIILVQGKGDGKRTACMLSLRALLDGRPFSDKHPSCTLHCIGVRINDGPWWKSNAERTRVLLPFAIDDRLAAHKCVVDSEVERGKLCRNWSLSWAAPFALDVATEAVQNKLPELAEMLFTHANSLRCIKENNDVWETEHILTKAGDTVSAMSAKVAPYDVYAAKIASHAAYIIKIAASTPYVDKVITAAYAAYVAANAADAATIITSNRKQIRDSLIDLFDRLLAVGQS